MTSLLWHDIVTAGVATLVLAVVLAVIGYVLLRVGAGRLVARKVPHAACGVFAAVAAFQLSSFAAIVGVLTVATVALVFVVEKRTLPDILEGTRARDYGLVGFAAGALLAVVALWPDRIAVAAGLVVLGLADAGAALVGHRFGRHRVAVSGALRSLEGSAAFAVITFAVSLAFTVVGLNFDVPLAAAVSTFVALTTAFIEVLVPTAADNLLITPWVALLLHLGRDLSSADALRWLFAAIFACGTVLLTARLRWLDLPGAIGGGWVAAVAIGLGGWVWLAPAATFFALTSLLTAYRRTSRTESLRGLSQVAVNGVLPVAVPVIGYALTRDQVWFAVYIGGVAASIADSWASEIGRFSTKLPVSLRTRRRVPRGTSGAVSPLGFAATGLGGLGVGLAGALIGNPAIIVVGLVAGIAGSLLDSLLGAAVQGRFRCPSCCAAVEDRSHCGVPGELFSGYRWIDNNVVNAFANTTGMAVAFGVIELVLP
ncbi:MAG TPA: DUF92 domain-containing protein [Mycobacterium sp.]|nr:DUF92 domain-containing protein [Mycobacterium sp.]